ncbi:hypothetical protein GGI23_004957, partial [Coemansia sp. RSA 2559]
MSGNTGDGGSSSGDGQGKPAAQPETSDMIEMMKFFFSKLDERDDLWRQEQRERDEKRDKEQAKRDDLWRQEQKERDRKRDERDDLWRQEQKERDEHLDEAL